MDIFTSITPANISDEDELRQIDRQTDKPTDADTFTSITLPDTTEGGKLIQTDRQTDRQTSVAPANILDEEDE